MNYLLLPSLFLPDAALLPLLTLAGLLMIVGLRRLAGTIMVFVLVSAFAPFSLNPSCLHFGHFPLFLTANISTQSRKGAKIRKEYNLIQSIITLSCGCFCQQAVRRRGI